MNRLSPAWPAERWRALLLLFLAVPQVYLLPGGLIDISLATVVTFALAPFVLFRPRVTSLLGSAVFVVLLGLLAVRVAALAWSPSPRAGLPLIVLLAQFAVTAVVMWQAVTRDTPDARIFQSMQWFYWPWVMLEVLLVVVFRLWPGVELDFLTHLGGWFAGHNAIEGYFGSSPNNATDVAKAGGVFLNANVAGIFLGVNGLAALAISGLTGSRAVRWVGVVALLAVPVTGSQAATILAVVLPLGAWLALRLSKRVRNIGIAAGAGLAVAAAVVVATVHGGLVGAFVDAFKEALVSRGMIWRFGAEAFVRDPLLGLGYGGWEVGIREYVARHALGRGDFPPHNLLLAAWARTGLAGLAFTIAFVVCVLRLAVRRLAIRENPNERWFAAFAGAAIAWVLIQGMGENTDVFGEIHLLPILSLLIAWLSRHIGEETSSRGEYTGGWHPQTPAIRVVRDVHSGTSEDTAELPTIVRRQGSGAGAGSER